MRIGLSCTTIEPHFSEGKIDGIGMYTQKLYDELLHQSIHTLPISFRHKKSPSSFKNGRQFRFSYYTSTLLSLLNPLPFSIHGHLQQSIDLFHATDHMIPQLKGIPIVATLHDAVMFQHPKWHSVRLAYLKKEARKRSLQWVSHFITISHAMVPELVEFARIPEEKITVIYSGISPWWHEKIKEEEKELLRQKYNLPEKFILFASTLQQKKNLPRLVEAYKTLPLDIQEEYPLVVAGRPGWGTEESIKAIQSLIEIKRGCWLNYVPQEDLRALFQSATLYIHPSLHEGFGLTLLEAFASETPVITSNVAAMPEIAGGAAFLMDPYSVSDIAHSIQTILTNHTLRDELIKKGRERVRTFSWKKCAKDTLKVYRSIT